jgi:phosphomannomutase
VALIKSISGFRGTIGGKPGQNLTPQDITECTAAYGKWVMEQNGNKKIVVGRDGRISGAMVSQLAVQTLIAMGMHVIDLGLSTTPTVEMAVMAEQAGGGIIFSASHNPKEWNALKLLNDKGEFISAEAGATILGYIDEGSVEYATIDQMGTYTRNDTYIQYHIDRILELPFVDVDAIKAADYHIVLDPVNSTGAGSMKPLMEAMGCKVTMINGEVTGMFAHNPEPLRENLSDLAFAVKQNKAHLGVAVDPDVDRLVIMDETGDLFGEEYTLVAVADYMMKVRPGAVVSNLSSTKALGELAAKYGQRYEASGVGEVHVVNKMKEINATVGGEGNGGIILPDLHYGRDAMVGIALFLTHLAHSGNKSVSRLRRSYPHYDMVKSKVTLPAGLEFPKIMESLTLKYQKEKINTTDGLRIDFDGAWVHMRPSNTEPIVRIIAEAESLNIAQNLVNKIMSDVNDIRKVLLERT